MGIAPITSLLPLSASRAAAFDLELLPMERVENSARTGDETYSPSNGKPARGSEDDAPDDDFADDQSGSEFAEDTLDDQCDEPSTGLDGHSTNPDEPRPISFFA